MTGIASLVASAILFICLTLLTDEIAGNAIPKDVLSKEMRVKKMRSLFTNVKKPDPKDNPTYQYLTAYYPNMPVDHLYGQNSDTFRLRYFYNMTYYKPGGPLFFYTGNEGYLESFAQNTGIMWDLAPQFNAAIVFAEHRYYGYTYPYGNDSYSNIRHLRYLDIDQVLADYVVMIRFSKKNLLKDASARTIAFGGSYGGMLCSWFRVAYPAETVGAWASSAPLLYFKDGGVPVDSFSHITKTTFVAEGCDGDRIPNGWKALSRLLSSSSGVQKVNNIFKFAPQSLVVGIESYWDVVYYVETAIEYMAMTDYPYSTNFLQAMPAWPVSVACQGLMSQDTSDEGLVTGLYLVSNVYYNGSGQLTTNCIYNCPDTHDALGSPLGWPYQECTQIIIEMCDSGPPNDFFWLDCTAANVLDGTLSYCIESFASLGWTPSMLKENYVKNRFGFSYANATNLVLTSGTYDPWYSGCMRVKDYDMSTAYQRGLFVYEIEGSAHHLDLRQPNTCDPANIQNVRYQITNVLWCWAYPADAKCTNFPQQPAALPPFQKQATTCNPVFGGYPWGQA